MGHGPALLPGEGPLWVEPSGSIRGPRPAGIGPKPGVQDHAIDRQDGVESRRLHRTYATAEPSVSLQ